MQLSPLSRHFISPRSRYSPQHSVLKHPPSMYFPECQRRSYTPLQDHRQRYSVVYFTQQCRRQTSYWLDCSKRYAHLIFCQYPSNSFLIPHCQLQTCFFFNSKGCISFETSQYRKLARIPSSTVASKAPIYPAHVVYGCSHTGFQSILRKCWLYGLDKIWGLRDHEMEIAPLVHPFLWRKLQ